MNNSIKFFGFLLILIAFLNTSCNNKEASSDGLLPVTATGALTGVRRTTAECTAYCVSTGSAEFEKFGVCWNETGSPSVKDSSVSTNNILGSFPGKMHNLKPGTKYYARAFAENKIGEAYGKEKQFTTMPSTSDIVFNEGLSYGSITDIEGNVYKTIDIGTQTWMAENLRTTRYNDNSPIELVTGNEAWSQTGKPAYCWYENSYDVFGKHYGALYNWLTVISSRLCPTGWHVPSDNEWKTLELYLGMSEQEVSVEGWRATNITPGLMEVGNTDWLSISFPGTNETGFTALGGGCRNYFGAFDEELVSSYWWTSTGYYPAGGLAWFRSFSAGRFGIKRGLDGIDIGYSVRCIMD